MIPRLAMDEEVLIPASGVCDSIARAQDLHESSRESVRRFREKQSLTRERRRVFFEWFVTVLFFGSVVGFVIWLS